MPHCFRINPADNVATMLDDATAGEVARSVVGDDSQEVTLAGPIRLGHKVALVDIPAGEAVLKFGVVIGRTSRDVRAGEWVHLHNLTSGFDERSGTFDTQTGAATDTKYE